MTSLSVELNRRAVCLSSSRLADICDVTNYAVCPGVPTRHRRAGRRSPPLTLSIVLYVPTTYVYATLSLSRSVCLCLSLCVCVCHSSMYVLNWTEVDWLIKKHSCSQKAEYLSRTILSLINYNEGLRHGVDWGWTCPPHFCQRVCLRLMQIRWV